MSVESIHKCDGIGSSCRLSGDLDADSYNKISVFRVLKATVLYAIMR